MHDAATLAGLGRHLLERVAPDLAEARLGEQLARADARDTHRRNTFTGSTDHRGRIRVRGELDTESWAFCPSALEPLAKPVPTVHPDGSKDHDPRTVGQRQADALVELARRALDSDPLPGRGGYPAHLAVTIDLNSLTTGIGAGVLDTGTPISAQDVRRMACECTVLPVLLGTDGIPLDVGRAIRVFTKELRRAVEVRDIGCAFPGCAQRRSLVPGPPHPALGRWRTHQPRQRSAALRSPPPPHPPRPMDRAARPRPQTRVHPTRLDRPRPETTPQHHPSQTVTGGRTLH